jgi:hypothetical protein
MGWLATQFAADLNLEIADRGIAAMISGKAVNVLPSQKRAALVFAAGGTLDTYQRTIRVTAAALTAAGATVPTPRKSLVTIDAVQYRVLAVSTDPVATSYLFDLGGANE